MKLYSIIVYIPKSHLEEVKNALFSAGAGKVGLYENCCWQTSGEGQFKPREGSDPFIGSQEKLETVKEYKVELVCEKKKLKRVIKALRTTHPYQTPAYIVTKMVNI